MKHTSATNFDLPSLHILLDEINVALKDAEIHLSEFHEDEDQVTLLLDSVTAIEQLSSIFKLINFQGGDKLALAISQALKQLHDSGDSEATELIMDISEGIMMLDRYIEFVLLKEVLEPSLVAPIINKLRNHLGQDSISVDELSKGSSVSIANPDRHYQSLDQLGLDKTTLVVAYRAGLAVLLTNSDGNLSDSNQAKVDAMAAACATIANASKSLFWQAAKTVTAHLSEHLPLSNTQKRTLIYLEQQFLQYLPLEDRRFADVIGLACQYDQNFAHKAYQQYNATKDIQEQAAMQRFLVGPNREITDTLNNIIQDEISIIKEKIDSFVRGDNNINAVSTSEISQQILQLGLSLQLLGLDKASKHLKQAAKEVAEWQTPTPNDFDTLLAHLMSAENAAIFLAKSHTPGAIKLPLHNQSISLHQLDTAYDVLVKESRTNLANIMGGIDGYLADSNKDILHLQNTPEMLEQVVGASDFLNIKDTAKLLNRLKRHIKIALDEQQSFNEKALADIADVIVAADYQLEAHEQNRPVSTQALLIGQHSLNRLLSQHDNAQDNNAQNSNTQNNNARV